MVGIASGRGSWQHGRAQTNKETEVTTEVNAELKAELKAEVTTEVNAEDAEVNAMLQNA